MTLAGLTLNTSSAYATGPDHPVKIVKASKSAFRNAGDLDFSIVADPGEVLEVGATAQVVDSKGTRHLRDDIPRRELAAPPTNVSVQSTIPGTRAAVERLVDGVYARRVEATATLRGAGPGDKPLTVQSTDYFKIAGGKVTTISSEEYTATVQPIETLRLSDGKVLMNHKGVARASGRFEGRIAPTRNMQSAESFSEDFVPTPLRQRR